MADKRDDQNAAIPGNGEDAGRRVLVTGAAGMLGSQVLLAAPDSYEVVGSDMREAHGVDVFGVDLTQASQVEELVASVGPGLKGIIHCAAYTAVDKAEEEPEIAKAVNVDATAYLARAAARAMVPLVVVSTDFVFNGAADEPYDEAVTTSPSSVYGSTKLAGEQAALEAHPDGTRIVRTQWLYGPRGSHFPGTMQRLARERDRLSVVADQFGSPTSTLELAPALWDVFEKGAAGVYHASCEGSCSWYELAVATIESCGIEGVQIERCTTDEFPRAAKRPPYSVLDCTKLAELRGATLAPWKDALQTYLGSTDE